MNQRTATFGSDPLLGHRAVTAYGGTILLGDGSDPLLARIVPRFQPACILMGSPTGKQLLELCIVVLDKPSARMRWSIGQRAVDLFISNLQVLRRQITSASPRQIVSLLASAKYVYGDRVVSDEIQALARGVVSAEPPAPHAAERFRVRTRPFDLFRSFDAIRKIDHVEAGVLFAQIITASIDGYFSVNRVWLHPHRSAVEVIAVQHPDIALRLKHIIDTPLSKHCVNSRLLKEFVVSMVGKEYFDKEFPA